MNKLSKIIVSLSFIAGSLYAHGDTQNSNNHMGDHMHNGVMTNHANPNGMTNEQMHEMQEQNLQNSSSHMGDHMHNGMMTNHANPSGMTNEQMNGREHENK